MKLKITLIVCAILFSISGFSQNQREFDEMYSQNYKAPGGNYNKIKMKFGVPEGKEARNYIDEIKNILGVKDPNGFFNPYWVTGFPSFGYYKNEAVIIGTWYTTNYEGYNTWFKRIESRLNNLGLEYFKIEALGQ
jgi:hypothetical protein